MNGVEVTTAVSAGAAAPFTGPAVGERDPETVAREFAGVFYSMMVQEMQKTVPANSYFGGQGEEVFRSLWMNETGRRMAMRRGDELTEAILKSMDGRSAAVREGITT